MLSYNFSHQSEESLHDINQSAPDGKFKIPRQISATFYNNVNLNYKL